MQEYRDEDLFEPPFSFVKEKIGNRKNFFFSFVAFNAFDCSEKIDKQKLTSI